MGIVKIPDKAITRVIGRAVPKPANNQNTDDIVPGRFLKEITFGRMGEYVYYDERRKDGQPIADHPFNDVRYRGANILIAGANYGCGSSREHAPQALMRYGIKGIIAESFAEIFAGNCASIGVVGVTVPAHEITKLAKAAEEQTVFDIELAENSIKYHGGDVTVGFDMPEGRRQAFLNGTWDALALLQQNGEAVKRVKNRLPYLYMKF